MIADIPSGMGNLHTLYLGLPQSIKILTHPLIGIDRQEVYLNPKV